jgi:hypothetical protein
LTADAHLRASHGKFLIQHRTPSGRIAGDESAVWRVVFATMVPIWIFTVSSFRPWGQHYYNDVLDATRCS